MLHLVLLVIAALVASAPVADALVASAPAAGAPPHPHIFFLLLDDYGWANIGYHSKNSTEIVTPNLDALAASGVILNRQ